MNAAAWSPLDEYRKDQNWIVQTCLVNTVFRNFYFHPVFAQLGGGGSDTGLSEGPAHQA